MLYKTICFELLQQNPAMHEQLRKNRQMLPTLNRLAGELKSRHEAWKEQLSQAKPDNDQSQIASQAAELALKELEERLSSASRLEESEPLTIEAAMAFVRNHTPPA